MNYQQRDTGLSVRRDFGLRWLLLPTVLMLGSPLMIPQEAAGQTLPQYRAIESQDPSDLVVFGADEILSGFGIVPGYQDEFTSTTTFYNSQVTYRNGTFYLWTQTGWDGAGCVDGNDGLDNVIISKSTNPAQLFRPTRSSGTISKSEMRRSMATDSLANDLCTDDERWGIGDVIEFPTPGRYMATFDLGEFVFTQLYFYLAESDGTQRPFSNPLHKFLDSSELVVGGKQKIIVEPIMYKISSTKAGFIYQHCSQVGASFSDCTWNYGFVNFSSFPTVTRVRVQNTSGVLQDVEPNTWKVRFPMGSLSQQPGGMVNTIVLINGQKVAVYGKGTKIGYRALNTKTYGHFLSWGPEYIVKDHNGQDLVFSVGDSFDIRYPAVVKDNSGTLHLFYTHLAVQ